MDAATLDQRLRTLLPPLYQDTYETVRPVSMGSAALKYGPDGRVAWGEIWQTFCDLALAGGPPHKGRLLVPPTPAEVSANPAGTTATTDEVCRGVRLVTGLPATAAPDAGWVRVSCGREAMAAWVLRAIVAENVPARREGAWLDLPAGPGYRVEKEVKNVITAIAKTCHYWTGHMPPAQQQAIAGLFVDLELARPLVTPDMAEDLGKAEAGWPTLAHAITTRTGLTPVWLPVPGWFGVECGSVRQAVWLMRALIASNVLARREETVVCLPRHTRRDADGAAVLDALAALRPLLPQA